MKKRATAKQLHDALVKIHTAGGLTKTQSLEVVGGYPKKSDEYYNRISGGFAMVIAGIAVGDFVRGFPNPRAATKEANNQISVLTANR